MGTARVWGARFLGAPEARPEFERIARLLLPLGIEVDSGQAYGGADMSELRKLGVPAFELAQDFTTYFDIHHTENDTVDRLDAEGLAQSAAAYAGVAWAVSEMQTDFGRVPDEKKDKH
jgi:hypothetical protein